MRVDSPIEAVRDFFCLKKEHAFGPHKRTIR